MSKEKTISRLDPDVLDLKCKLETLGFKVEKEPDTGWIDVTQLMMAPGIWRNCNDCLIRRRGDWVYFEMHTGIVSNKANTMEFPIGKGFDSPWRHIRATVGTQPPEIQIKDNKLSWIGFVNNNSSVVSARLMWRTDDPFPIDRLKT